MAILKQKFVTIRAENRHLDEIASRLVHNDEYIAEEPSSSGKNVRRAVDSAQVNPCASLKERLKALEAQLDKLCDKPIKDERSQEGRTFSHSELEAFIDNSTRKLSELTHTCESVKRAVDEDKKILEQLGHLKGVDIPLEELFNFDFFKLRLGYIPTEKYEKIKLYVRNTKSVIFTPFSEEKDYVWGTYIVFAKQEDEVDNALATLGFKRVHISGRVKGKPEEAYVTFSKELAEIEDGYADTKKELDEYVSKVKREIPAFSDELGKMSEMFELKRKIVMTDETFCVYGWMPERSLSALKESLAEFDAEITEQSPEEAELEPPVILKNPSIFKPFESFVNMYGTPAYNEIDPTVFFALTYSFFFGLMFGDIGQGAVLLVAGLAIYLWKRINLAGIIAFVGAFSIAGGFLYGSVFGNEEIIHGLFVPSKNISTTLFGAVAIGVVMIIICAILNIINGIKQKNIGKYLLSPNGLVGVVFYVCALVLALAMFDMLSNNLPTTALVTIAVVCAVLLFVREPLEKLIERKRDWLPKNIGASFAENFFELFEVILSYVTNTISFIRIGAFALSHAGMMTVVYLLAETASGGHNPLILVIGNLVVIGVEGMVVCIQVLRLEFYELFSRYYMGTGRTVKKK